MCMFVWELYFILCAYVDYYVGFMGDDKDILIELNHTWIFAWTLTSELRLVNQFPDYLFKPSLSHGHMMQ